MKKLIISITLTMFLLPNKLMTAQNYRPMAVDSVRWVVEQDDIETPWYGDDFWEYYALGDTLVNGTLYKKIYKRDLETYNHNPPYYAVSPYILFALIRDDIEAKKVYAVLYETYNDCAPAEDALYFDFSLSAGDTANNLCVIPNICGEVIVEETGVDEFFGIYTRYLSLYGGCTYGLFMEGIGSSYGLFEAMFTPVKRKFLTQTNLAYYCPTAECPVIVSSSSLPAPVCISVYPNPAENNINVEMPENSRLKICKIEIYNAEGKLVCQTIPSSAITQIPVQNLPSGLYLLRVWDGNRWTGSKVVKE